MSYFLDRLRFFRRNPEPFADGHGFTKTESRDWEDSYRARWQYDKIVRSTHGVNCTGSCRSEEHTSELQSLMRISYAVFCLKKKKQHRKIHRHKMHRKIAKKN